MLYLVRTTDGSNARMRDGEGLKAPVKDVSSSRYTLFCQLPGGLTDAGGPGVEVKIAADELEAEEIAKRLAGHVAASTMTGDDYAAKVKAKIGRIMRKQRGEPEPWAGADNAPTLAEVMAAGYREQEARAVVEAELAAREPAPEPDLAPEPEPEAKPKAKGRRSKN